MSVYVPADGKTMLHVPVPVTPSGAIHDEAPLFGVIVTVPAGMPPAEVTPTDTVTGCPGIDGFGDEETVMEVAAAGTVLTICVAVSLLLAKCSVAV